MQVARLLVVFEKDGNSHQSHEPTIHCDWVRQENSWNIAPHKIIQPNAPKFPLNFRHINSSRPRDDIWRQRSGSTLVQAILSYDLYPVQRPTIPWADADLLSIGPLGTNFSEIWIKCNIFLENIICKMAKLIHQQMETHAYLAFAYENDIWRIVYFEFKSVKQTSYLLVKLDDFQLTIGPWRDDDVKNTRPGSQMSPRNWWQTIYRNWPVCHHAEKITRRPKLNGSHSPMTFSNALSEKKLCIFQISPKIVPGRPTNNNSALVHLMDWCRTGAKPLPEPMLICLTYP